MSGLAEQVVHLMERLLPVHSPWMGKFGNRKVLTFVGTSSSSGQPPTVRPRAFVGLESADEEVQVVLGHGLTRAVQPGESVAVSLVNVHTVEGFQLKGDADAGRTPVSNRGQQAVVGARRVYTVHHTPNTATPFDRAPTPSPPRSMVWGIPRPNACTGCTPSRSSRSPHSPEGARLLSASA